MICSTLQLLKQSWSCAKGFHTCVLSSWQRLKLGRELVVLALHMSSRSLILQLGTNVLVCFCTEQIIQFGLRTWKMSSSGRVFLGLCAHMLHMFILHFAWGSETMWGWHNNKTASQDWTKKLCNDKRLHIVECVHKCLYFLSWPHLSL